MRWSYPGHNFYLACSHRYLSIYHKCGVRQDIFFFLAKVKVNPPASTIGSCEFIGESNIYHLASVGQTPVQNRGKQHQYSQTPHHKYLCLFYTLLIRMKYPHINVAPIIPWQSSVLYVMASLTTKPTSPKIAIHSFMVRSRLPQAPSITRSSEAAKLGTPDSGSIMSFIRSTDSKVIADLIWRRICFAFSSFQLWRIQPR